MAFVDELTIFAKAGDGGDGVVRWRHEKGKEFGGPSGGNGGDGGDVYIRAVRNVHLLSKYKTKKEFIAERGEDGGSKSLHGARGKDLDIELPIGSIVKNKNTDQKYSLTEEGQRIQILSGGEGGRGNESFKSSTNQRPKEFTEGTEGESAELYVEVELIADIGLIGLPNAGKTSLLNELTNAQGKIGAYPFTTIDPNLGEVHGYIISDIPGLIEGAAEGKGLGHTFLKHVRRTKMLVHLISLENEDLVDAYQTIRNELTQFDDTLQEKKEIVIVTKTDLCDEQTAENKIAALEAVTSVAMNITLFDDGDVKKLQDFILQEVQSGQ